MMSSYLKHLGAVVLCSSALAVHPQGIQQQPEPPMPPDTGVTFHVQVNSVLVPVVVRDALGHTVGDLSEKDFKVLRRIYRSASILANPLRPFLFCTRAPIPAKGKYSIINILTRVFC